MKRSTSEPPSKGISPETYNTHTTLHSYTAVILLTSVPPTNPSAKTGRQGSTVTMQVLGQAGSGTNLPWQNRELKLWQRRACVFLDGMVDPVTILDIIQGVVDYSQPFANPASCVIETLLDSGATYPILPAEDLENFGIAMKWYPAQGIMTLSTITGRATRRFFEMHVSVCSQDGESLVGDQAVWPEEPRVGGLCPVMINPKKRGAIVSEDRISGMLPFESCYMSSAPTAYEFWLGEDRRDVLGARRLPAHLRWSPEKNVYMKHTKEFVNLRASARTPDQVIFIHHLDDEGQRSFVDQDWPGVRGKSELAIMEKEVDESTQRLVTRKKRSAILEPREGTFKEQQKNSRYSWRRDFLTLEELTSADYKDVGDSLPDKKIKFNKPADRSH
ncbi:hypothetical protein K449DRAFT_386926 [Hypoxylon sp. EC38]|nr:hypothetical protein K449DRAFT_386926 [Hypoxylon sp. EC38]